MVRYIGEFSDNPSGVASENMRRAEENASGASNEGDTSGFSAGTEESSPSGLYTGTGRDDGKEKKGKGKGFFRQKGPAWFIGLFLLGGGLMGGAQLFQPFSLIEQFRETFNSMQTSTNLRSNAFFHMQMDSGRIKNPIKGRLFRADTFKISNKQKQKLSRQGIDYDNDFEGTGLRVLKFDDGTGKIRIVAADDSTAKALTDMGLTKFNADYNSDAVSFKALYSSNSDFANGYNKGSLTWRGAIANWFNSLTAKFLSSNKITRNLFQDYQKRVAEAGEGNTRKVALDMMAKGTDEITEGGVKVAMGKEETETDSDGNTRTSYGTDGTRQSDGGVTKRSDFKSDSDVEAKLKDMAEDYNGGSVLGTASKIANGACLVLNFIGGVSMLVTAAEALQIVKLVTSYFEAIDAVKSGKGSDVPIHELMDSLNENKTNKHASLNIFGTETEVTYTTGSAMQSNGIASTYSRKAVNASDPSVQSFNFSKSIKRILGGVGLSMTAFETCAFAKMAANIVSMVQSGIEIGACVVGLIAAFFTFGASSTACSGLVADILIGIGTSAGLAVMIGGIITTITPLVSNFLTRDLISNIGGEDLGNALTSGANMYLGNTHRANGGSLANKKEYTDFALAQQQVIAENAKYERSQRSPFDITSKYTFMGNIMTQMMSFLSVNSVMSVVSSTSSVLSSSIVALSPTASAWDVSATLPDEEEYKKTCPYLASIGAVGDAFCNPYSITDVSTINVDPADVINYLDNKGSFLDETSEDGNVVIAAKSDLAKYILYCDNRSSSWGIADQNIANEVENWGQIETGSSFGNSFTNGLVGGVPIIGDVIDVVQNGEGLANLGYIGGESCVAGNTVSNYSASPNWSTAQYYQRFIEDQSLAESMGLIGDGSGKSAVTAFLDEYFEEHPLDNSYEGILARYSGLTKETVIALLDKIDYYTYIANYDASTRYAFGAPVMEEKHDLIFDNENQVADTIHIILLNEISFADIRNRVALV